MRVQLQSLDLHHLTILHLLIHECSVTKVAAKVGQPQPTISRILSRLRRALSPSGFNLGANLGRSAGAGIADHFHWHIVPRWEGDTNFMTVSVATRVVSESLESSFQLLAPLFKALDGPLS